MVDWTILLFILSGFLGGLLRALMDSRSWSELKGFKRVRDMIIGLISGYVYYFLHSEWNYPNGAMSVVAGYFGADFILKFVGKFRGGG